MLIVRTSHSNIHCQCCTDDDSTMHYIIIREVKEGVDTLMTVCHDCLDSNDCVVGTMDLEASDRIEFTDVPPILGSMWM